MVVESNGERASDIVPMLARVWELDVVFSSTVAVMILDDISIDTYRIRIAIGDRK